jgi:Tol biopolymer transport system component
MRRLSLFLILLLVFAPTAAQDESDLPEGEIVFGVQKDSEAAEIYLIDIQTAFLTNLSNHEASDSNPAISPDGRLLVFTSMRGSSSNVHLQDLESLDVSQLTYSGHVYNPIWSIDGHHIYYSRDIGFPETDNLEIFVMESDGTNQINVTENPAWDMLVSLSPDGREALVYSSRRGNQEDVYVLTLDTNIMRYIPVAHSPYNPTWSPDGTAFIYHAYVDGQFDLFWYNLQTGESHNLSSHSRHDEFVGWLPNERILFISNRSGQSELYAMNLNGTGVVPMLEGIELSYAVLSPDSQYIAYTNRYHEPIQLFIAEIETGQVTQLTQFDHADWIFSIRWRPQPTENN